MQFKFNDGGREAAGFKGKTGDCVPRAIAIVTGLPYREIYDAISERQRTQRVTKRTLKGSRSVRNGTYTKRKWFKDYMASLGFRWVPTMAVGKGTTVHLHDGELPNGRLIVAVSRHYTAVIDGVIHDTFDPQREFHYVDSSDRAMRAGEWRNPNGICGISRRAVYGYWIKV